MRTRDRGIPGMQPSARTVSKQWSGSLIGMLILVLTAFTLRMVVCAATAGLGRSPEGYREYVLAGQRLLARGSFTTPLILDDLSRKPSSMLPPLYAGVVAGVYGLLGTETFAATLTLEILNAAATSLAVLFVFLITQRLARGATPWLAALIVTFNPTVVGYISFIWDTSLFTLAVTLAVWLALRRSRRPLEWGKSFGFGLVLGGLALLNPALTIAYPLLVLWMITRAEGWRVRPLLRSIVATMVGWVLVILPWTVRNYVHSGELMYIRSALPIVFWLGVCPEAETNPAAVYGRWYPLENSGEQAKVTQMGEYAYLNEWKAMAYAAITSAPGRYLRLTALRTVDYWAGTAYSHKAPEISGWPESPLRRTVALFVLAEVVLVAIGLLIVRRPGPEIWWLLGIVFTFSIIYCLTHVQIRYRAPAEPLMAVVVATVVSQAWSRIRKPPRRSPAPGLS